MSNGIEGEGVVITGARSGLGEAPARRLAARGGEVSAFVQAAVERLGRMDDIDEILLRPTVQEL